MWILLSVLFSFSVFSLDPSERIANVKILKTTPENIIQLNRGTEDGISRNDHARISSDNNGYSSRAICLSTEATTSYWKIYRVPYAEFFSKDYTYVLYGMADREIPEPHVKLRDRKLTIQEIDADVKADTPDSVKP